jgi:hypothetical protein
VVGAGFAEALELACFAYLLFFYFVRIHGNGDITPKLTSLTFPGDVD